MRKLLVIVVRKKRCWVAALVKEQPALSKREFMKQLQQQEQQQVPKIEVATSTKKLFLSPLKKQKTNETDPATGRKKTQYVCLFTPAELLEQKIYITPEEIKTFIALCDVIRRKLKREHPELFGVKKVEDLKKCPIFAQVVTWGFELKLSDIIRTRYSQTKGSAYQKTLDEIRNLTVYFIETEKVHISCREEIRLKRGYHLLNEYEIITHGRKDQKGQKRQETVIKIYPSRLMLASICLPGYSIPIEILRLKGASFNLALFLYTHSTHQAFSEEKLIQECRFSTSIHKKRMARKKLYEVLNELKKVNLIQWQQTTLYDGRPGVQIHLQKLTPKNATNSITANHDPKVANHDPKVAGILKKLNLSED